MPEQTSLSWVLPFITLRIMGHSSNSSEKSSEIDRIFERAEKLRGRSLYPQSISLFKKALRNYKSRGNSLGVLHCALSLGDTYRMTGMFDRAKKYYMFAIDLAKTIPDPRAVSDARIGLALSLRAQGKWNDALKLIRESRATYRKLADREGTAFSLWAEAGALRVRGDITRAIKVFREAHAMFKTLKDPHGAGYALCGLGGTSRVAGFYRDSKRYYETANRLFSELNDTFGKAYSFCGIGNAFRMVDDYKNALRNFTKATTLYRKIGDKVSYSYTLWSTGMTHALSGNSRKARDYFMRSKKLFQRTKDPRGIIYCRLGLGQLALTAGRHALAQNYFEVSLTEAVKYGFRVEACHAKTLLSHITYKNPLSPSLSTGVVKGAQGVFHGKRGTRCYNRLGLKLRGQGLPLNIP
jgi:tetratricopeptide (TPR) repeat protein